jgi:phosphoenolpyruvate---glycerone phosphotransferase subunit DhaL
MVKNTLVIEWLRQAFLNLEKDASMLTELDAQIGDADHGINMVRGFQKVNGQLPGLAGQEIGAILKTTGMALIGSVGGASGPLYGSFFLDAAKEAGNHVELSDAAWSRVFGAGLAGIRRIGKANPGDKTMLDALGPGLEAFQAAVSQAKSLIEASEAMVAAAARGRDATTPMVARKGRASYLGERSAGHMDPGAASAHILLSAFAAAVSGEPAEKP